MTAEPMFGRRKLLSAAPVSVVLAPAPVRAQSVKLTLGTAEEGGAFVPYAAALLDLLKSVDPILEIRAVPTKGTGENVPKPATGAIRSMLCSSFI